MKTIITKRNVKGSMYYSYTLTLHMGKMERGDLPKYFIADVKLTNIRERKKK